MPSRIAAQRQFLVSAKGIDGAPSFSGYFSTKSGGETTSETTKHYDGGKRIPDVLAAPAQTDDVTLGRGFRPEIDQPIIKSARAGVGRYRYTVSTQPTDEDLVPLAEPTVYPDALLSGMTDPEVDANSGDVATFEVTFTVGEVA